MAINTDKYKVRSNILVRMLTPFFLKGLKVLEFLSGISYPLDELNVAYRKWVAERIVDAVTTFQPIVLKWSLNTRFRQYFKDKNDSFDIIPYTYKHYLTIYEDQDEFVSLEDPSILWGPEDTTEINDKITNDNALIIMDQREVKKETDSFVVVAPPINVLIADKDYRMKVKQVIEYYRVYQVEYDIYYRKK